MEQSGRALHSMFYDEAVSHLPLCPQRHTGGSTLDNKEVVAGAHLGQGGGRGGRYSNRITEKITDGVGVSTSIDPNASAHIYAVPSPPAPKPRSRGQIGNNDQLEQAFVGGCN